VRLFGQSPSGMNATGESDLRNYWDMIGSQQEARLRRPLTKVYDVLWRSALGTDPPSTFAFKFNSLYQMNEMEKAEVSQRDADTVKLLHDAQVITTEIALKEMKQSSILTGRFTNISDEDIKDAADMPPPWEQPPPGAPGLPGQPGAPPGHGGAPGANAPSPGLRANVAGAGEPVKAEQGIGEGT
jgi:hypothetical protein